MVSALRCPAGARGLLALLLLLLPLPGARGSQCKTLELPNGRVHSPDLQVGATATFSCNAGYRLIGTTSAQCVAVRNGADWDKEPPHCEAIPCRPPPDITHGSYTGQSEQNYVYGSAVTYRCDQRFSLIGEASIHCTTKDNVNGEWSRPAPECKVVKCREPEVRNGKKQSGFGPDYSYGNTVIFECDSGYTLKGSSSIKCEANNSWVPSLPTCVQRNTGTIIAIGRPCKPLELENGRADLINLWFGATANSSCNEGYRLIGPISTQCVLAGNGVDWDKEVPLCQVIPCLPPPDITHGSHNALSGEEFSFGSAVTYKCDQGFSLIGEASIHCTTKDNVNGEWSGPAPECRVGCLKPEVQNGNMVNALDEKMWYTVNETIPFKCSPGYQFSSHSLLPATDRFSITCLSDGITEVQRPT